MHEGRPCRFGYKADCWCNREAIGVVLLHGSAFGFDSGLLSSPVSVAVDVGVIVAPTHHTICSALGGILEHGL